MALRLNRHGVIFCIDHARHEAGADEAPTVSVGFYIATAVFATNIERTARAMLPYFLTLCVGLLVAFFPWVTLALPKLFNLAR